jgi:fibronectin-binding autotransporter adhesin
VKPASLSLPRVAIFSACLILFVAFEAADAGSATWSSNPLTNIWNNAANWMPMTVPNGPTDTASFATSNIIGLSLSANVELDRITFEPGASTYTIATGQSSELTLSGAGIINDSDQVQNFVVETGPNSGGVIVFSKSATAANNTSFTNHGGPFTAGVIIFVDSATAGSGTFTNLGSTVVFQIGGFLQFGDNTTAENAVLVNKGGTIDDATGGQIGFAGHATAANSTITNEAGLGNSTGNTSGGTTAFSENSTAANATITNKGSTVNGGTGGVTFIGGGSSTAHAGNATIIAESGSNGGGGGTITFVSGGSGDTSRIEVFGNGTLNFAGPAELSVGSLEGDGIVVLTPDLKVGANNLSTTFSGVLQSFGKLNKIGAGTLTLSGANTNGGGMVVSGGTLIVNNTVGSGTGSGAVQVNGGTLSGGGIIAGTVTVGTGSAHQATLAPAIGQTQKNLKIQSALTFQSDATLRYSFKADGNRVRSDRVTAKGVTISSGATFSLSGQTTGTLTPGLVITVINNKAATPISGTFSNLPDGGIVNVNGNNLQASYSDGDGNDLTLTVQ